MRGHQFCCCEPVSTFVVDMSYMSYWETSELPLQFHSVGFRTVRTPSFIENDPSSVSYFEFGA